MISEDGKKLIDTATYSFAEFNLEAENLLLLRNSEVVPLAPKAVEVLLTLLKSDGKLITKQEILDKVWADTFVEEANLTHHISALRKALGEDKNGRKFIETIPRRGYRFVAEVKNAAVSESAEIVFNERTSVQVVEEMTVEANDLPDDAEMIRAKADVAPVAAQTSQISIGKSRRSVWILAAASVLLIGTATFFGWRYFGALNKAVAVSTPEITFKRLTPDADADAPSIAPDGASIVFVKNENGKQSLWRKQIASGELTQLTPAVSMLDAGFGSTRFSPDGRWIYFTQLFANDIEKDIDIYRIPSGSGTAQKILSGLEPGVDFSISPDGRQLAYTFDYRQLIVADIETGNKRVIVDWDGVKKAVTNEGSVAWSPDGSRLIFPASSIEENLLTRQLFEINLPTGNLRQIQIPENFVIKQMEWLADDSGLIVTRDSKTQNEIWQVNHHTGAARRISNDVGNFGDLRVSADGKTLVAKQWLGQFNIWTAPADNIDKRRQITIGAAANHGQQGLAQMPDGRIVYTSSQSGANDIWIMNADGGERRQLTVNAGTYNLNPRATADGRYIVFNSTRSGTNQIWRMDADGGNPVQLSKIAESWNFSISPENDVYYITFLSDEQKYQIYKVPVAGGEPIKIDDYYSAEVPQFSPDGKWILFFGGKTKDEKPRVGIIERATGKVIRYFDNGFMATGWMPDSKAIVDTLNRDMELWQQPIDGSAPQKIYDFSPLKIQRWDFSADGKQVILSLGNSTSEIVAIQNFSETAK